MLRSLLFSVNSLNSRWCLNPKKKSQEMARALPAIWHQIWTSKLANKSRALLPIPIKMRTKNEQSSSLGRRRFQALTFPKHHESRDRWQEMSVLMIAPSFWNQTLRLILKHRGSLTLTEVMSAVLRNSQSRMSLRSHQMKSWHCEEIC